MFYIFETKVGAREADKAMKGQVIDPFGGIDFNANNLQLKTQGEEIRFNMPIPADLQGLQPGLIDGLTPVIINITPISNFPLLLGLSEEDEPNQISHL